jgi:hypothetical protein
MWMEKSEAVLLKELIIKLADYLKEKSINSDI